MPIYEFECKDCGGRFELLFANGKTTKGTVCKHCGSKNVKRALSTFAAHMKDPGAAMADAPQRPAGCDNHACRAFMEGTCPKAQNN